MRQSSVHSPNPNQNQNHQHQVFISSKIKLNFFHSSTIKSVEEKTDQNAEDPDKYDYKIDDLNDADGLDVDDEYEDEEDDSDNNSDDDIQLSSYTERQKVLDENPIKVLTDRFSDFKLLNKNLIKLNQQSNSRLTKNKTQLLSVFSDKHSANTQQPRASSSKSEINFIMNPSMNALQLHSKKEFMKNRFQYLCNQNAKKKTSRWNILLFFLKW
jgi:hypothetical protein